MGVADPSSTDSETEARRNDSPVEDPKQEVEPPCSGCDPLVAPAGRGLGAGVGCRAKPGLRVCAPVHLDVTRETETTMPAVKIPDNQGEETGC